MNSDRTDEPVLTRQRSSPVDQTEDRTHRRSHMQMNAMPVDNVQRTFLGK
jgi:hypothetical protein